MFTGLVIRTAYFLRDMRRRGKRKKNPPIGTQPEFLKREDETERIPVKISVIVPVYNGGQQFKSLLEMLEVQERIGELEVVIVDSGSSDGSVELAEHYGAKIIRITQDEFSHSHARNLGAECATGEYLLFMTQDACPTDSLWLRKLFQPLYAGEVSAVSCREIPREDCDLFGKVRIWEYYDRMGKNGQLINNACLIKKSLFERYLFRLAFAEDFDLGIRLMKDGYPIVLLSGVQIIHSHTRTSFYHLKRAMTAAVMRNEIQPGTKHMVFSETYISDSILTGYSVLKLYVSTVREYQEKGIGEHAWNIFCKWTKRELTRSLSKLKAMNEKEREELLLSPDVLSDMEFQCVIRELYDLMGRRFAVKPLIFEKLRHYLCYTLTEYFDNRGETGYDFRKEEICVLSEKLTGLFCGDCLGLYASTHEDKKGAVCELVEKYAKGI